MPVVGVVGVISVVRVVDMARAIGMIGVRPAVPPMRTPHPSRIAPTLAGTSPPQARQGAGYGLGGVVLFGTHRSILHAT